MSSGEGVANSNKSGDVELGWNENKLFSACAPNTRPSDAHLDDEEAAL